MLSPFLFCLVLSLIWSYFPPPLFPSHRTFTLRLAAVWIIAFADDLAVACPSVIRLSRCLTKLRDVLRRLWLEISLKKTEVVTFLVPGRRKPRSLLPVRIAHDIVPPVSSFKYLGVTISSNGSLAAHQRAMSSKANVAAYEVAKLLRKLEITCLKRLSSYVSSFVDGQFYGAELFPLHAALEIDSARQKFVCSCFDLPAHTAKNLTFALFPVLPGLFLLLRRRASFYKRAQVQDLSCVRESFLFDMCQLYPDPCSWTFQLLQMFQQIGIDLYSNVASFPRHLDEIVEATSRPDTFCFTLIQLTDEKTLSFFRCMPDANCMTSFRSFLSSRSCREQNFFLLFFTSGLRWRFFVNSGRGACCPCCQERFWSWEHFLSCQLCPVYVSVPEIHAMIALSSWLEVARHAARATRIWLALFDEIELSTTEACLHGIF